MIYGWKSEPSHRRGKTRGILMQENDWLDQIESDVETAAALLPTLDDDHEDRAACKALAQPRVQRLVIVARAAENVIEYLDHAPTCMAHKGKQCTCGRDELVRAVSGAWTLDEQIICEFKEDEDAD